MTMHLIINGKTITFEQPITLRIDVPEPYVLNRNGEILTLLLELNQPAPELEPNRTPALRGTVPMSWTMGWKKFKHEVVAKHLWLTYSNRFHKVLITREAWVSYLPEPMDRSDISYVLNKLVKRGLVTVRGKGDQAIYGLVKPKT